jgi:hypothetical protein
MREKNLKRRKDLGTCVLDKQHVVGIGTVYTLILNFLNLDFINKIILSSILYISMQ